MIEIELSEIKDLPSRYRPLSAWAYFGYSILFALPLVGFICLIIFSFEGSNINRRSFARSYFCFYVLVAIIILIVFMSGCFYRPAV